MKRFGFLSLSVITCFLLMFTSCLDSNGNRQQGSCYAVAGTNSSYTNTVLYTSRQGTLTSNSMGSFTPGKCYITAFTVDYDDQPTDASANGYLYAAFTGVEEVPLTDSKYALPMSSEFAPRENELEVSNAGIADFVKKHLFLEVISKQAEKETIRYDLYYHPDSTSTGTNNETVYNLYLLAEGGSSERTKEIGERVACKIDSFWDWAATEEIDNDVVYVCLKYVKSIDKSVTPAKVKEWGTTQIVQIANDKKKS